MLQITHYTVYGVDITADSRIDPKQMQDLAKNHLEARFNATFLAYLDKNRHFRIRPERCDHIATIRNSDLPTLSITNRAGTNTTIWFAEGAEPSMFDQNARNILNHLLYDSMFIGLSSITNKPYVD